MSLNTGPLERKSTKGISKREVLARKLNSEALALWDVLNEHVDNPTAVLREILGEVGGETLYLPVVKSAEKADVWFRLRAGEKLSDICADMEEIVQPHRIRQVAHQTIDEL